MLPFRLSSATAAVAAVALTIVPTASASLIVNGSFEESSLNPGGTWIPLAGGSSAIDGWTTTLGGVDYMGTIWAAADGNRFIDLNNVSPGGIQQSFATVAGGSYLVTFALSANMFGGPAEKVVEVSAGGSSEIFTYDYILEGSTQGTPNWKYFEWTFVATGSTSTLSFTSLTGSVYGATLDDVTVVAIAIPAPASLALLALGGLVGRRRRTA